MRLVNDLHCIVKRLPNGKVLCAIMNLPYSPTRYTNYILDAVSTVTEDSMKSSAKEIAKLSESGNDIAIAFDGSEQKNVC